MSNKETRKVMGTLTSPVIATRVLSKKCKFDHAETECISWIAITEDDKTHQCNTYNGKIGIKGTPNIRPLSETNIKGYEELKYGDNLPAWINWA